MVRITIKGGVWKNTEDEILKAAVMKYGLNQWSRISSLLVRKSAKQCKARWFEWLDPAIKKTEWTREEDEKLLHLAKLLPCQWRTIAPIVGRTPAQCLERYEKLLDMAMSRDERYDHKDDPRRLRPGEIDPNPETKPARPDAVDMDEDEKEMLSEARARLANTRGKKAKRKAREKQLEEARRLAALQKKRELKAAGIETRERKNRYGAINYNAEVAFERKPAAGFYETGDEDKRTREMQQEFRPVTVEELEGRRRKDIEEALIKRDVKRQKLLENHDLPQAVAQAAELNDPGMARRRGKLMLPSPQVSEAELEQIARMGADAAMGPAELAELEAQGAGGAATRGLLGQYSQTAALPTALRTPRTAPTGDRIMQEAENLAKLANMRTVLEGGDNPDLHTMDFSGVTPKPMVQATPNPLAAMATPSVRGGGSAPGAMLPPGAGAAAGRAVAGTPLRAGMMLTGGGGGMSALHGGMPGATPLRTPLRDELGINDMDALVPVMDSKRAEAQRLASLRFELRERLGALPAPQNEYAISVPELPEDGVAEGEGADEEAMEEDAADARARREREEAARLAEEEKKKSKALQRGLPRPVHLDGLPAPKPSVEVSSLPPAQAAEELLLAELTRLLNHDALKYPPPKDKSDKAGGKKESKASARPSASVPPLEQYDLEELQAAADLLEQEARYVAAAMGHSPATSAEDYLEVWRAVHRDLVYLPGKGRYDRAASATNTERLEAIKVEFEGVRGEMQVQAKRAAKLEQKVNVLVGGLQKRDGELRSRLDGVWQALREASQELVCFKALRERELRSAPERIEELTELVAVQAKREEQLQERFKALTHRRDELMQALQQQQQQQQQPTAVLAHA